MLPVGQQSAKSRDESEGLVEHDVVLGLRNFDHRCRAAQEIEHVLADLRRKQNRMLATKYCDTATRSLEALSSVADRKALPDRGIEFPVEPTRNFLQGVSRDPIDEIEVFRRLRRHEAKPCHRRGQRRVDVVRLDFTLGWTTRSVGWV